MPGHLHSPTGTENRNPRVTDAAQPLQHQNTDHSTGGGHPTHACELYGFTTALAKSGEHQPPDSGLPATPPPSTIKLTPRNLRLDWDIEMPEAISFDNNTAVDILKEPPPNYLAATPVRDAAPPNLDQSNHQGVKVHKATEDGETAGQAQTTP